MFTIIIGENPSDSSTVFNPKGNKMDAYADKMYSIMQPQMPLQPFAFFNGWWLPPSYKQELRKFLAANERPLDIMYDSSRIAGLQRYLEKNAPRPQEILFGRGLNEALGELVRLREEKRSLYNRFKKKINQKERDLAVPKKVLEEILREWVIPLVKSEEAHNACHGGETGWTPERSIAEHIPFQSVLTGDIADAYRNTNIQHVFDFFYSQARKRREENAEEIAGLLTLLTTVHYAETGLVGLPQGSPASTLFLTAS